MKKSQGSGILPHVLCLLFLIFIGLSPDVHAYQSHPGVQFFPPQGCVNGQNNIVVWGGEGSPTRCMQVPTCTGDSRLQYDGGHFFCNGDDDRDHHHGDCPNYNIPVCQVGYHVEAGDVVTNGCASPSHCVQDAIVCPVIIVDCAQGYHPVQQAGHDANGCPLPATCQRDQVCPVVAVDCGSGYHPVQSGYDANGCQRPAHCERTICPANIRQCPPGQHNVPGPNDQNGCPTQLCEKDQHVCPLYNIVTCPYGQHVVSATDSYRCTISRCEANPHPVCPNYRIGSCPWGQHISTSIVNGCAIQQCVSNGWNDWNDWRSGWNNQWNSWRNHWNKW